MNYQSMDEIYQSMNEITMPWTMSIAIFKNLYKPETNTMLHRANGENTVLVSHHHNHFPIYQSMDEINQSMNEINGVQLKEQYPP